MMGIFFQTFINISKYYSCLHMWCIFYWIKEKKERILSDLNE